jgi:hypothetical protein
LDIFLSFVQGVCLSVVLVLIEKIEHESNRQR